MCGGSGCTGGIPPVWSLTLHYLCSRTRDPLRHTAAPSSATRDTHGSTWQGYRDLQHYWCKIPGPSWCRVVLQHKYTHIDNSGDPSSEYGPPPFIPEPEADATRAWAAPLIILPFVILSINNNNSDINKQNHRANWNILKGHKIIEEVKINLLLIWARIKLDPDVMRIWTGAAQLGQFVLKMMFQIMFWLAVVFCEMNI